MVRVGLLSDTHGFLDPSLPAVFRDCDEIWHAGDVGSVAVVEALSAMKPFRGVYGNVDDLSVRSLLTGEAQFTCAGVKVYLTHITGYPGRYDPLVREVLRKDPPQLLIGGHSHILRVMHDETYRLLYVNPGAAGRSGMHQVRTVVRFSLEAGTIHSLEVVELGKR